MAYLLDTNTVSDLIRRPRGPVRQRVQQVGVTKICTSIIVAAELRYGAAKKQSPRLTALVEAALARMEVLPFDTPADTIYGRLRAQLEEAGQQISGNDLLIAAHALALGLIIVTDNEREFARIDELPRENWLRVT
jgi:tRNA(fMet)-specific endonuclease VapC